jgi:hypothetical protein
MYSDLLSTELIYLFIVAFWVMMLCSWVNVSEEPAALIIST